MRPKILFTASIPQHFKAFHLPYLEWFQSQGYETHVACNGYEDLPFVDKYWQIPFERSPFSSKNIEAYKALKKIINKEGFHLIHCHTPVASVLTRIASVKARQHGTKLLYTAHGFHFFKGASILNWLLFYPTEIFLTRYSDAIICINNEDFNRIKKYGSTDCNYFIIPGIGVDNLRFFKVSKEIKSQLRDRFQFDNNEFLLIYAAEFIPRKNHEFIIKAVQKRPLAFKNTKILFAGKGELEESLKAKVLRAGLENYIHFIGFRKDIDEIFKICDVGISSSAQEGLGLNLVEEMMCGLPIVATVDRGHKEVVDHNVNGFLFDQHNDSQFCEYIIILKNNPSLLEEFSDNAIVKAQKFEINNSLTHMIKIYRKFLPE